MEQKTNESPENLPEPAVSCAVSVAGGDRRGLEEPSVDGACVQSVCSVHPWCVELPPQLGHVSAPCPCPFCGTLSHQDRYHRDVDVTCHQDLVEQELPVTGSAGSILGCDLRPIFWVFFFFPCFYGASGLFLLVCPSSCLLLPR